jgi:hypothetical protein
MFKKKDPNSFTKFRTLQDGANTIGSIFEEYQVVKYDDVQLQDAGSVAKSKNRKFIVNFTQRINIVNPTGTQVGPRGLMIGQAFAYNNYPVMIQTSASIESFPGLILQLLDYSPKTVNTAVERSGSIGNTSGATDSTSRSNTVGSSTSESNNYGASASMEGITSNFEHSSTVTNEQSTTNGSEASNSNTNDISNSESMSIKDWGGYALIDPTTQTPTWTFAQECPWNAIGTVSAGDGATYPVNPNQVYIWLPDDIILSLGGSTGYVFPPSHLSEFGINFVMKAAWLVTLDNTVGDSVVFDHSINYFSASHYLNTDTNNIMVCMDNTSTELTAADDTTLSTSINLTLLALETLSKQSGPSVIGFIPSKFTVLPESGAFEIVSTANNLLIQDTTSPPTAVGKGFSSSQTALNASFNSASTLEMTIFFKVTDTVNDYDLYMKHWNQNDAGVKLTLTINGDTTNQIVKFIDAKEAEGGENNITTINLRNQNFATVDYHDYLQLGLNSVQINIQPIDPQTSATCIYQIRAISIEKS